MSEKHDHIVRASEVGQYAYCARAWWLGRVRGIPAAHQREMAAGRAAHRRHGRHVRATTRLARLAFVLLTLAVLAAIIWVQQLLSG